MPRARLMRIARRASMLAASSRGRSLAICRSCASAVLRLITNSNLLGCIADEVKVQAGILMSYTASFAERAHVIASYVDQILKGAKPADLPVQQPTRYELAINLKTEGTRP
jgi:ABC-type uncharacterized transport system substrate-binding protein